ncbi:unnamed protein product [Lymnaea stagnalis]|uniref:Uncharacterized protein n=1 Tax=Lymnaea stagnalis TaxID=6523 RepID=A0AAV2HTK5_LYMST
MCPLFGYGGSSKFRSAVPRQQVPNSLIMDALQRGINCVVTFIAVAGVSGYLASASSRGAGISDRLLRLKLLALRLEPRDVTRYNLETPKYGDNTAGYQATEERDPPFTVNLSDDALSTKRGVRRKGGRSLNRIEKASNELDRLRSSYTIFHNDLTNFVTTLPSKFRDDAPTSLSKVSILPAVLPVNDPALVNGNVDKVIAEWFNLRNVINTLLDNVERFLKPDGIDWLKGQRSTLSIDMIDVDASVMALRFSGNTYNPNDFAIFSSGPGGISPGTDDLIKKLQHDK